jgi:hypothetical protein
VGLGPGADWLMHGHSGQKRPHRTMGWLFIAPAQDAAMTKQGNLRLSLAPHSFWMSHSDF